MGQYHLVVNVTKKELINPHKLGSGFKQWEQIANGYVPMAIFALLCTSNDRGGGDLNQPEYDKVTGDGILGRWAGDDIRVVGDYSEAGDLPGKTGDESADVVSEHAFEESCGWRDISEMLYPLFEKELGVAFTGDGWKNAVRAKGAQFSILDK